ASLGLGQHRLYGVIELVDQCAPRHVVPPAFSLTIRPATSPGRGTGVALPLLRNAQSPSQFRGYSCLRRSEVRSLVAGPQATARPCETMVPGERFPQGSLPHSLLHLPLADLPPNPPWSFAATDR